MFLSTQTKQVLVTGGSGFIGGSFVRKYASKYKTFFTFHRNEIRHPKAWGWRMSLDSEVQMCHLFSELRPNIVLHTAGMTSAAECEKDWQRTYDINVRGTHDLLNLCNEFGARMIFLSTDFVFDGNRGNYEEQDNIFPSTRYGRSKQMAEEIVCSSTSSPHTVLRLALVYGFGIPSAQGMVGWLRDALLANRPVTLFTDEIRNPVYLDDVLNIIDEVIEKDVTGLFNIGGRDRVSRYDFGLNFARTLGYNPNCILPASIKDYQGKPPRPQNLTLNIARAQRRFKTVLAGVDDGLRRMRNIQTENDPDSLKALSDPDAPPESSGL